MARTARDPSELLRFFQSKRKTAPDGLIVNLNEMAEILQMTSRNLKLNYIDPDEDFPIESAGSEGKSYKLNATNVLDHLIKRQSDRLNAGRHHSEQLAKAAGVEMDIDPAGNVAVLSLAEMAKLASMTMQAQDYKQRQGKLIETEVFADFLARYNTLVVNGILGISSKVDPTSILPLDVRREMDEELRSLAVSIAAEARSFIGEFGEDIQQSRIAG